MRIFLNTKGTNDHEVRQELRDFLHYIETLDGNLVEEALTILGVPKEDWEKYLQQNQ